MNRIFSPAGVCSEGCAMRGWQASFVLSHHPGLRHPIPIVLIFLISLERKRRVSGHNIPVNTEPALNTGGRLLPKHKLHWRKKKRRKENKRERTTRDEDTLMKKMIN
ncbi:hypothetical protein ElyMa_006058500 [Elysia marginata]|uniref:Uncharacterized protein n=1 Tax=Elysia marginata TaxID=1093978 RepID=A0AAV4GQP0_9GAST|nr:hypothetical protein ElyMa_006058500 [Elysia marginata]